MARELTPLELATVLSPEALQHITDRGVNTALVRPPKWSGELYRVQLPGLADGTTVPVYEESVSNV